MGCLTECYLFVGSYWVNQRWTEYSTIKKGADCFESMSQSLTSPEDAFIACVRGIDSLYPYISQLKQYITVFL